MSEAKSRYIAPGVPFVPYPTERAPIDGRMVGEVASTRRTVQALGTVEEVLRRFPNAGRFLDPVAREYVSSLCIPLLRERREVVGALSIVRGNDIAFTPQQVTLLEAFADQAVIAIENARLFNELQDRNREVTEALDRQTAMGEVLSIIASSATDASPVLQAIAERAASLCVAATSRLMLVEGDTTRTVALWPSRPARPPS
jgi:GAF domain-containing protein